MTYEMLVGDPPVHRQHRAVDRRQGDDGEADRRPRGSATPSRPSVEHAVLTALQKLPADRFASAKEFADALVRHRQVVGQLRPDGRRPHALTRLPRLARAVAPRVPRRCSPLISIAAVAAGWLFAAARARRRPHRLRRRPPRQRADDLRRDHVLDGLWHGPAQPVGVAQGRLRGVRGPAGRLDPALVPEPEGRLRPPHQRVPGRHRSADLSRRVPCGVH